MKADYWHDKWAKGDLGFHQPEANTLLTTYFDSVAAEDSARVFVPLCGKTRDIAWLLSQGHHVIGVELSQTAIDQLFADLDMVPDIQAIAGFQHYRAPMIDIFVGDIFGLKADHVGDVDVVYDRAALVALPDGMRRDYAQLVQDITDCAPQLVLCFNYDQSVAGGPPFAISAATLGGLYAAAFDISELESRDAQIRGTAAVETAWQLRPLG